MQLMAIEFARNVAKLPDAHTVEVKPDAASPIVDVMPDQKAKIANKQYGGTMRLGAYPATLKEGSIVHGAYGAVTVSERHRHRYEINPAFIAPLEVAGLVFSGVSPLDDRIMEFAELPRMMHPFMVGTQAHPELQARPLSPHPLFTAFMKAAMENKK
jgi:CTP synthase